MNPIYDEELLINPDCRRQTKKSERYYKSFISTSLILLILSQGVFWMGVGIYGPQILDMVNMISSIKPEIQSFLDQAQDDLVELSNLAEFIEDNITEVSNFLNNLTLIEDAAQCTISNFQC